MTKQEFMGLTLLVGALLGCAAVVLSMLFHAIDARISDDWEAKKGLVAWRDRVRVLGLFALYGSWVAMIIGAAGFGIAALEGV